MKIVLFEDTESVTKFLNVQIGRFDGSLLSSEVAVINQENEEAAMPALFFDLFFVVGFAALWKT